MPLRLILLGLTLFGIYSLANLDLTYNWQWFRVWPHLGSWNPDFIPGLLLLGLKTTLQITAASLVLAIILGLLATLAELSPWALPRVVALVYVESIRNTPLLLQLFMIYFFLADILSLSPKGAAILSLSLFEGAYLAGLFKAGLLSVSEKQWEAAKSLGFSASDTLYLVIFPQAFRNILPPLTSEVVSLIKNTALVSAIAVTDLTMRAQEIISATFLSFEIWLLVAGIYLILTLIIALPAKIIEQTYKWS